MIPHQPTKPVTVVITRGAAVWRLDIKTPLPPEPVIRKHAFVWLHERMDELDLFESARKECRLTLKTWLEGGRHHEGLRLVVCDEAAKPTDNWLKNMMDAVLGPSDHVQQLQSKGPSAGKIVGQTPDGKAIIELNGGKTCPPCHGKGKVIMFTGMGPQIGACPWCAGTGKV